jgi:hypothetical protein
LIGHCGVGCGGGGDDKVIDVISER